MASKKRNATVKRRIRYKLHCRFKTKIMIDCLLLVILLMGFICTCHRILSSNNQTITYKETGTISDYKVYLKDNNFYDKPYLEKGMAYVASLIDHINIKYNYKFETSTKSDLNIKYKVIGKLIIASQNNSNIFYEKEYDLSKDIIDEMVNKTSYVIDRDVIIDYQLYNDLANQFRANYAVKTTSRLEVYLQVQETDKENNSYKINNMSTTSLIIPLTEQEISMKENNLNNTKQITQETNSLSKNIINIILLVFIVIFMIIILGSLLQKIYLFTKKNMNEYDKYIRKILIGYDRIIINVKSTPNKNDYNVIEVEDFQELVDVRDNTKEPINYHVLKEHEKSEFYVINDNNLYLYTIEASFLNKDESNE